MKRHNTLTLEDGREIVLLLNMNALINYTELTGLDIESLEMKKPDMRVLKNLAWAMALEGEASAGRELAMTVDEFGRMITPSLIVEIVEIMRPQLGKKKVETGHIAEPPQRKGRPMTTFLRKVIRR